MNHDDDDDYNYVNHDDDDDGLCNVLFVSHSPRHVRLAIMMMMVFVKLLMTEEPICTDYLLNIHPDKIVPLSFFCLDMSS